MKKIGLVLDGGGGKGAYHIGVWKYLKEVGFDNNIKAISGTSVGGLNACLFALNNYELAETIWTQRIQDKILSFHGFDKDDFEIQLVEILYHQQFGKIHHKDILGALMNLGIKRECIGDIDDGQRCFFACTKQTYPYIAQTLKQIKKAKVRLQECYEDIEIVHDYISRSFILSSMRLDKVVSAMFKVSRQLASEAIRSGHVKVNYKIVEEVSYLCHNNDMVSFKHHGRVKIVDENKQTRQGNHVVSGYFYK